MHVCISIYDWPCDTSSFELVTQLKSFVDGLGIKFLAGSLLDSSTAKSKKMGNARLNEFLKVREPLSEPKTIEMFYGDLASGADVMKDWECYVSVTLAEDAHKKTLIICWPESVNSSAVVNLITSLASIGHLCYGIGFSWNKGKNPAYHAFGITHGFPETEAQIREADDDRKWFEERLWVDGTPAKMRHKLGMFRDIYEINIINSNHLSNVVEGGCLKNLIQDTNSWGSLISIENRNWIWRVPKKIVPSVRYRIEKAGWLLV